MARPKSPKLCDCGEPAVAEVKFQIGLGKYRGAGQGNLYLCRLHFVAWIRDEYGQQIQFLDDTVGLTDCEKQILRTVRREGPLPAAKIADQVALSYSYAQKLTYRLYRVGLLNRRRVHHGGRGNPYYLYRTTVEGRHAVAAA